MREEDIKPLVHCATRIEGDEVSFSMQREHNRSCSTRRQIDSDRLSSANVISLIINLTKADFRMKMEKGGSTFIRKDLNEPRTCKRGERFSHDGPLLVQKRMAASARNV
jgi:hypothetical protein